MLRTSRQSNYWGLVQQRGPWEETAIDIQRLKNSKTVRLGGGVDDGGTVHAGHGQWRTSITPNTQYSNLPPCPNPSTYAQIYNLIPGPPQLPPLPGRLPQYIYTDPNQEKQGSFHPTLIFPRDPSESYPTPKDPVVDELVKAFEDAKAKRDLVTGPFGHTYDTTENPEIYTNDEPNIRGSWNGRDMAINSQYPIISQKEPRTSYTQTSSQQLAPPLSYSQITTNSILPSEHNRQITLTDGSSLTVPSIMEARLRTSISNPEFNDPRFLPSDPDFISDLHSQLVHLIKYVDESTQTYLTSQSMENNPYATTAYLQSLAPIQHFLGLLGQDPTPITNLARKAKSFSPEDFANTSNMLIKTLFNRLYAQIPPLPTGPEITEINGLPNTKDQPQPASTTRRQIITNLPTETIAKIQSQGLRYTPPEVVITTPLQGTINQTPSLGHQLINSAGAVATSMQKLSSAAGVNHSLWQNSGSDYINLGPQLSTSAGIS
jgi:hypothetical protein